MNYQAEPVPWAVGLGHGVAGERARATAAATGINETMPLPFQPGRRTQQHSGPAFVRGKLIAFQASGQQHEQPLPFGRGALPPASNLMVHLEKGEDIAVALDSPCLIAFDGEMPMVLASEVFKAGSRSNMLEPVRATIAILGRSVAAVNVLDHNGGRTGNSLPAPDGRFTTEGALDRALYYEVRFR